MKTLLILLLLCSPCYAMMEGVWTGDAYKADTKVLVATTIQVDTESGEQTIKEEKIVNSDVAVISCVEYNGKCEESEYFKVTIKDVDE